MSEERVIPNPQTASIVSFTVIVNGSEIDPAYNVYSISISNEVNKIPTARVQILDGDAASEDFTISNSQDFVPGNTIVINAGYHSDERILFEGIIMKHGIRVREEKPTILDIECKHVVTKLTRSRQSRYFSDSKDSDIVEEILRVHGFGDIDISETVVTHKQMVQYQVTDWDFIISRAEANGMVVIATQDAISMHSPEHHEDSLYTLQFGATIHEFEGEIDATRQYEAIRVEGWNSAEQENISEDSDEPDVKVPGNLTSGDLSLGYRDEVRRYAGPIPDQELRAWAHANLLKSRLSRMMGYVKFQGQFDAKPGLFLDLSGLGDRFQGDAFISGVRHEIYEGKWYTIAQLGLSGDWFYQRRDVMNVPAHGLVPGINGLQIGIVTKLSEDPEGEHRVKVKFPSADMESDGIWAKVASLDAGNGYGSYFLPEIGMETVVGFLDDDPRNPVILGSLNSSANPPALEATDENHEKGLVTRGKLRFLFDDDKKWIRLETPSGKVVTLDDDSGSLSLEDEHGNKLILDADGIALQSTDKINLKAKGDILMDGVNIQQNIQSGFKVDCGTAELSATGTTTIKGGIVQIN